MSWLQAGKGGSRLNVSPVSCGLAGKIPAPKQFRALVSVFSLAFSVSLSTAALGAQQVPQSDNLQGGQSTNSWYCSDPVMASTPECSTQGETGASQLAIPQTRSQLTALSGTRTGMANGYYSDSDQLSRQSSTGGQVPQALLPPEPLTEFQKFVASTTSEVLPIFGANLFRRVPSTFAPLEMTPVPADYVIGPDDQLRIRVWGQVNFQANVRVDRSGDIFLPQVGPVHVAGIAFSALDGQLRTAIGRIYHNFDLNADIGQIRAIQVYVAGQARRPGVYTVSSLSTLVDALFASGGPSVEGSLRHIELRRGSVVVTDFDLYDLLVNGDKSKDVKLQSGDVIFIRPVGPQAAVTGSVRNPAIYELRDNDPLSSLLASAGGSSAIASDARISIERIENRRDRYAMEVANDASGLATPMAGGDLVRVYSLVPNYRNTVTLRGNIANPGRFAWHPGMRVSELIPDKESLITRNYWWRRAQLGLPGPDFEATTNLDRMRQPAENYPFSIPPILPESANARNQSGSQQSQAGTQQNQIGSQQGQSGLQPGQSGLQSSQLGSQPGQSGSLPDQYGLMQGQNLTAQQRSSSGALASALTPSANQAYPPGQRTEIRNLAPAINWDYASIERLDPETLKNSVYSFDLGKLVLQHDASQDLELKAGDVVSIFSEADIRMPMARRTKLVTLEGEFEHSGVYTVQPGETLRQLVERVGGVTPNSYMFGSEFTRESTRAIQQERIDEYVQSLSMQVQRGNMAVAASGQTSGQDVSSAAAQSSERLLASLRQIRATGRVVLTFQPSSTGTENVPEIPLEDGDRFVVPPVPATVNVVGAVYDSNTFLYASGRRVATYLRLAGGPNTNADKKHSFIIRADGEVVSSEMSKGMWGNEFANLRTYPGDTIVVPEKTIKPSTLRTVMTWSQLFSQLALGAASLSVLVH